MIKLITQNNKNYNLCKIVLIPSTEKSDIIMFGDRLFFSEKFTLVSESDICFMNSNDIGKVTHKHGYEYIEDFFEDTNRTIFCLRENGDIYSFGCNHYGDDGYYQYKLGEQCFYQNLYFTSDEEIKENDYFFDVQSAIIIHWFKFFNAQEKIKKYKSEFKKIIASTDTSLRLNWDGTNNDTLYKSLPKPTNYFIKEYIRKYNINSYITNALVEYCLKGGTGSGYWLKVNNDNTINIVNQKESWTREEVIEFAKLAIQINSSKSISTGFNWIEENL